MEKRCRLYGPRNVHARCLDAEYIPTYRLDLITSLGIWGACENHEGQSDKDKGRIMSDLILTCHEFIVPMTQTGEPSILSSTPTILPTTTILENLSRKKLRTCAVDEGEDSCVPNELGAASPVSAVTTILPDCLCPIPLACTYLRDPVR